MQDGPPADEDVIGRSQTPEESNRRLRVVLEAANDAFISMDAAGRITEWNRQAEVTFGWARREVLGSSLADTIVPPQHRAAHRSGLARFLVTRESSVMNRRLAFTALDRAGREFAVELSIWASEEEGTSVQFHAFVHDISGRQAYEEALRASEARHRRLAEQLAAAQYIARIGSWEWDIVANRVSWSDPLYGLLGIDPEHCVDQANFLAAYEGYLDRVHPEERELAESAIGVALETRAPFAFDHRVIRPDRSIMWVHSRVEVEVGADGVPARVFGTVADVTERVTMQQELTASALFDELTGLHNRRAFITLADHQLKVAARAGRPIPLLFLDMDGMKDINDTYGHTEGDRALAETALFLRTVLRSSDLVARIGGDEFCVLMVDATTGAADLDIERVVAELRKGPPLHGRAYPLTLSVGVARLEPGVKTSVEDLMGMADTAMYADKGASRHRARVLVVEDDAGLRRLAELSMRDRYEVVTAATGWKALKEISRQLPDLILLDLNLPDMQGGEVLRRLRRVAGGDRVAVIVLTAAAGRATELETLSEGVDDFVAKPLDLDILEARIANVLHRASSRPRRLGA